jgi:hypothetical protein
MKQLVEPLTVTPVELEEGDKVMVVTVACHVIKQGDRCYYRLYRCGYPPCEHEGIPQGSRILDEAVVAQQLFPVVTYAGLAPDEF